MPFEPTRAEESAGMRLRRLRQARGYSQRDLGAASGVSFSYISRLEAGSRLASVRALRALAQALEVTTEYLEDGVDLTGTERLELRFASTVVGERVGGHREIRADLDEIVEAAKGAADYDLAGRAQVAAGEAALRAGDHAGAVSRFEEALGWDGAAPAAYPELYVGFARACRALGLRSQALGIVDRALASLVDPGPDDPAARARLLACQAELLTESGGLTDARTAVARAVDAAEGLSSVRRARSLAELARTSWYDGAGRAALREMRRACTVVSEADARLELGRAALFCAEQLVWSGDHEAAGSILDSGAVLVVREDAVVDARVRALEAAVVAPKEPSRALRLADDAERLLADADPARALVLYARARSVAASRRPGEASAAFGATVEMLEARDRRREAAFVCREWGHVMRTAGESEQAAAILDKAVALAAHANAERIRRSV